MATAPSIPSPCDLSDRDWGILAPVLLPPKPGGRPRTVDLRIILNGIFHVLRSQIQRPLHEREPRGVRCARSKFRPDCTIASAHPK